MISVIIPVYNRWDLTHNRMFDLFKHIPEGKIEVIVVDDASPDEVEIRAGMTWWQKKLAHHKIRYARNPENRGFGLTCNGGAKLADGEILCFLSNDVVVSGDFISEIEYKISEDANSLIGGRLLYWDTGWNVFNFDGKDSIVSYVEGWMIACTQDVWKRLGGFDPIYAPYDYEDLDLSMTAVREGIKLVGLDSPYLMHLSGQSIRAANPKREEITNKNREKFFEKWKSKLNEKVAL